MANSGLHAVQSTVQKRVRRLITFATPRTLATARPSNLHFVKAKQEREIHPPKHILITYGWVVGVVLQTAWWLLFPSKPRHRHHAATIIISTRKKRESTRISQGTSTCVKEPCALKTGFSETVLSRPNRVETYCSI